MSKGNCYLRSKIVIMTGFPQQAQLTSVCNIMNTKAVKFCCCVCLSAYSHIMLFMNLYLTMSCHNLITTDIISPHDQHKYKVNK